MSGTLQNKLHQFEVAPPPAVWDKISQQLNEDFVAGDAKISTKLEDAAISTPAGMWDKINAELHSDPAEAGVIPLTEHKRIPLVYRRIAIAAVVAGLMLIGGLIFFKDTTPKKEIVSIVTDEKEPQPLVEQQPKVEDTGTSTLIARNENITRKTKRKISTRPVINEPEAEEFSGESAFSDYTSNPGEAPMYDLQTVSALQPVSVSAPPLRDKKGNIILDASLISRPDAEYIIVTGPNGKQTRISSKFLSCLGYINAGNASNEMDSRGIRCKTQFEEWRKKILAQPAFIPTANNFFDIFELKDLIQEM